MRYKSWRIATFLILLSTLLLSSCLTLPASDGSAAESSASEAAETLPPASLPPAPTDWHSGVKTDYSGLTPYKLPEEKYTRLKDGALPELMPSHYGKLLPYVGETMYAEWLTVRKYGLVTNTGIIVTDPVYSRAYQGSYYDYSTSSGVNVPVYNLEKMSGTIDEVNPWRSELHAVCALDGSWVTPFDYSAVFFTDRVMMLVRGEEKNDIDIMDYTGKLLYNTKSLSCYSDMRDYSLYMLQSGYGEGVIAMPLTTGRTVFIDAVTGNETFAEYAECNAFSNGLAAVKKDGLYGYIDKSLSLVIQPQFVWADFFRNGKSVVQYPDNTCAIIDASGNTLLKNQYYISRWDSNVYGVQDGNNNVIYYDSDLQRLTPNNTMVTPLNDGWFFYRSAGGVTVFKDDKMYAFKNATSVSYILGDIAVVSKNDSNSWQEWLITLDGDVVIPPADNQGITIAASGKTGAIYAIASIYGGSRQTFNVFTAGGKELLSGNGYAVFNPANDLFEVNAEQSFGYADLSGNYIFKISLLQYIPD